MGFRIQNNISALNTNRNMSISSDNFNKSLEKLSSGYRINSAKDDAAGLAISQGFRADIASTKVAQRNISEANSLLQTAEGAMSSVGDILTRMKELATQAASANAATDIGTVSNEYNTLVEEINRIANSTQYAGTNLTNGGFGSTASNTVTGWNAISDIYDVNVSSATTGAYTITYSATGDTLTVTNAEGTSQTKSLAHTAGTGGEIDFDRLDISFKYTGAMVADTLGAALAAADTDVVAGATGSSAFQIGYNKDTNSQLGVSIDSITTTTLGVGTGDISSASNAYNALLTIDTAIDRLSASRAEIGSYQNRLGYAASNLAVTLENATAAESVIRDVDMASEMTTFTKNQILVQAGTAMLAQANQAPQNVLSLLK